MDDLMAVHKAISILRSVESFMITFLMLDVY